MGKEDKKGLNDPRFSKVFSDPRFRALKKKDFKVKLDDRFNKNDLKKEFTLLKSNAKVDKYGRKLKKGEDSEVVDNLDKYYEDENEDEKEEEEEEKEEESESEDQTEDPLAAARGLVNKESTFESESDSSDEEVSEIEDNIVSDIEETENIPELDPTSRIAAVNLDWDHLNSTDLFATFSSFLPKDGYIKSVTIYKSEYGKQRIADEELNGPPREIFKQKITEKKEEEEDDDDDDEEDEEDLDLEKASKKLIQENNGEDDGFDSSELRKYQLQRLRYYYAVIEFNNIDSAKEIYKKCDSTEYESSGNFFDLRFIPIDMKFDKNDIRDSCKELPTNYEPIEFSTDSLRNSKPKLTWDETPIERVQMLNKSFKQKELDELDLKNYLASDSEDENNNEDILKYKQLVGSFDKSVNKNKVEEGDGEDEDIDMEFTFTPSTSNSNMNKEDKEEMSTIDKIREKEKERRRSRKQKVKELKRESQKNNRKKKNNNEVEEELQIEQFGADNGKELQHFNIKDIEKLEKLKNKKNKFKNKRQRELEKELEDRMRESNQEQLEVDERFNEMIDSHAFVGGSKLLQQERKRRKKKANK